MTTAREPRPSLGQHGQPITVAHHVGELAPHQHTSHAEHVVSFIVRGRLALQAGAVVDVTAGAMVLLPAGVPHRSLGGEGEWWMAAFCASCLGLHEDDVLMRPFFAVRAGAAPLVPVPRKHWKPIVRRFEELRRETEADDREAPILAQSLLQLLLGEVCRAATLEQTSRGAGLASEVLAYVHRHAVRGISLKDVAKSVHRTPAHVAATVKEATGHTVGTWIRAARIAEACRWLLHSDDGLDAIAARVGYGDKTHFIRQFRKVHEMTPAAWRSQHRS